MSGHAGHEQEQHGILHQRKYNEPAATDVAGAPLIVVLVEVGTPHG